MLKRAGVYSEFKIIKHSNLVYIELNFPVAP